MLAILIFSWIVSVLLVLLAERNNGYSSSLSHDEKIKRIREKKTQSRTRNSCYDCKAKRRTPYMDGAYGFLKKRRHRRKQKRQHRENTIIMYFPGFIQMLLSVHKPKVAFFMTTTQTFETILTPDFAVSNILRIFAV